MSATPNFEAGTDGTAFIATTEVPVIRWTVNDAAEIVRFRNSLTGTTDVKVGTYTNAPFTIVFDWDKANILYGGETPVVRLKQILTGVKLYLDRGTVSGSTPGVDATYWNFPKAIVMSRPQTLDVGGKIGNSINMENSGIYYGPNETPAS